MNRMLPAPGLSFALLIVWLLLSNSVSPGQILLGLVVAVAVPRLIGAQGTPWSRRRLRLSTTLALMARVAVDIVRSNLQLAVRILGPESAVRPAYVWVPVSLEHPVALSILAGIITLTPGTVSADIAPSGRHLLVHAFDVPDEDALIREIQQRYETPLREIFR